ncbi:CHAT domain-containing protein [Streptomyces phaeoluteigriseus]|uniref:CHAT domain-containing protein n=1 Tax=Streptomyces phaeoluteigriseus TaxID=114686 RepID=UPI00367A5995
MSGLPDHLPPAPPDGALELATLLSFATRIEPELMRAVRHRFLPGLDAGAEADLWFSDWVGARTPEAIAMLPQCLPHLRADLVERLRSEPDLSEILSVVQTHHRGLSPALALEEQVTWHALTGHVDFAVQELDRALHALVRQERSGLAGWFAEAWHRLPDEARSTTTAWSLAHASRPYAPAFDAGQPPNLALADITPISDSVGETRLGVLREGTTLLLGQVRGRHAAAILVPATDPRLVEVVTDFATQTVQVARGGLVRIDVGNGPAELRTGAGLTYQIEHASTASKPRSLRARVDALIRLMEADSEHESLVQVADMLQRLLLESRQDEDPAVLREAVRLSDSIREFGYPSQGSPGLDQLLAEMYLAHGLLLGRRKSLTQALIISRQLLDSSESTADLAAHAVHGAAQNGLFWHIGDIALLSQALGTLTPVADPPTDAAPDHRRITAELLTTYALLYETSEREDVLRDALHWADRALATPEYETYCALPLARLLLAHHEATGDLGALRRADNLTRANEPPNEPKSVQAERQLLRARSCLAWFRAHASRDAFEDALEHARSAVLLTPSNNKIRTVRPRLLLAGVLRLRFALAHERKALDEAVNILRLVAVALPASSPWNGVAQHDLARCLLDSYRQNAESAELGAAHEACRAALSDGRDRHPVLAHRQAALALVRAECLLLAYAGSREPQMLRRAVRDLLETLETGEAQPPTANRSAWYPTAGIISALLQVPADAPGTENLIELLDLWKGVVKTSTRADPTLRGAALSSLFLLRARLLFGSSDSPGLMLDAAAEDARLAAASAVHPLRRLQALLQWGELAVQQGANKAVADAHERVTRELMPLRVLPPDREHQDLIAAWERLSREAAACAIEKGRPDRALDILEQRSQVLAEFGADRPGEPPSALSTEVRWLWAYLHLDADHTSQGGPQREEAWRRMTELADDLPTASGSVAAKTVPHPASVASEGPVVVLNAATRRCDALLVTRQGVSVLPLKMRLDGLRERAQRFRDLPRDPSESWDVLDWLGASTVWPILRALGLTASRSGQGQEAVLEPAAHSDDETFARSETLPRIWWCPTGPFTMLPLHAAGSPERSAMDHAVHSYTPSLHALADARRRERRGPGGAEQRMLVVQSDDGPYRIGDQEVGMIRQLVAHVRVLRGSRVTLSEVFAKLPTHPFFHYSGHAGWHEGRSLLHLAEGLDRRYLPHGLVPDAALAYLSACDTAGGDSVVDGAGWMIAASFQYAGFRHVIGTLGVVDEQAALLVATSFYRLLQTFPLGLSPERAARALHGAVRELGARSPLAMLQASAMVHLGP